jgi:hypothetical protein
MGIHYGCIVNRRIGHVFLTDG